MTLHGTCGVSGVRKHVAVKTGPFGHFWTTDLEHCHPSMKIAFGKNGIDVLA